MKNNTLIENSSQTAIKKRKRKRIVLAICSCIVLLPLLVIAIAVGVFATWANTQSIDKSLLPTGNAMPVFYDIDGNELPSMQPDFVDKSEVSHNLKYAFVALEDKRFYEHKGYDVVRMGGALLKNIKSGAVREGASTITQQLVKNTHLTHERTLSRKLKELAIAIKIEKEYEKDDILAMYMSVIYFGSGAYGVKQAAREFFGKSIDNLTLAECATLAGIVRNPAKYSPISHPDECVKRRNLALSTMFEQGYISETDYQAAAAEPVTTAKADITLGDNISVRACEFYLAQAQNEVCEALGITKYQLGNSGLKIYTNLDCSLQEELELQRLNRDNYESQDVNSVAVILDNDTGAVFAYSSSYPYAISRQAGSVLKPLAVYAPALENKLISLATPIVDEKINFGGFSPSNYGGTYYGDTTVREAIKKSMNSVSVKVLDYLGVDKSVECLENFGIQLSDSDKNYALALGATANGISPLSVAGGYSTFARGGEYKSPYFVRYVVEDGNKILSNEISSKNSAASHKVISNATSALITAALVDTVKDGTAKSLSVLPFEIAAKTGTAERSNGKNSDAWCVSYNEEYTVLVWHGNDGGMTEKGGGYPTRHAAKIWNTLSCEKQLSQQFDWGDEIVAKEIDIYSTKCKKQVVAATENTPLEYRKTEFFALDNIPSEIGSKFDSVPKVEMQIKSENGIVDISFETESIYAYELYRMDIAGSTLIYSGQGDDNKASIFDRPLSFGNKVEYTLICHLAGNEEISSSSSISMFVDDIY